MRSTWDILAKEIRDVWHEQGEADRGVEAARSIRGLLATSVDLGDALTAVRVACECLWDNDLTAEACALATEFRERVGESVGFDTEPAASWLRLHAHVESARAHHRAEQPRAALGHAMEARRLLIDRLDGTSGYRKVLSMGPASRSCNDVCAVLSIGIPAARAVSQLQDERVWRDRRDLLIGDALRLTVQGHRKLVGESAYALANQLLLAVLERGHADDETIVQRLIGLDGPVLG